MHASITIRQFEPADEPAVIKLWTSVFEYNDAPHNDPTLAIHLKQQHQPELFFVALLEDRIIGTIMVGYDGHRAWLYAVAVDPDYQRRGVGRRLVEHAERAVEALGAPKINLQIFGSNSQVIDFYKNLGYRVEERISMGKRLVT